MINLIKMDMRRMLRSPILYIFLGIVGVLNFAIIIGVTLVTNAIAPGVTQTMLLSDFIANPFYLQLFLVLPFVLAVGFSYTDIGSGYVKNLAGQLTNRSLMVGSKFVALGVQHLLFMLAGSLSGVIAALLMSATGAITLTDNGMMLAAIGTFVLKWLLMMGITSLLMLISIGLRNKVLGVILGVVFGTGTLSLAYMGINSGIESLLHVQSFDLGQFMPDALFANVSVSAGTSVLNAVIVSAICIIGFITLTSVLYNKRDI